MPNWTSQQQEAIEDRGSNLLVAAAAGSGKTAVLVERIIRLIIEDKIDIDKLLIVTFTNAAAGEMRERISAAILKALDNNQENEAHLRKQMTLINRASITTIHAFCIEVVKQYFHVIDIDPSFRIGDTSEINIMKMEAMEELLDKEYEKADKLFLDLVESFAGSKDDEPLKDLISKIFNFIQSQPKPFDWLSEKVEAFNIDIEDFNECIWADTILKSIDLHLTAACDLLVNAKKLCMKPAGPEGYIDAIDDDLNQVNHLKSSLHHNIEVFYETVNQVTFKRLGRVSKETDQDLKEEAKDQRDKAKALIKGITEGIFSRSPEAYIDDLTSIYPLMQYLASLVSNYANIFMAKKKDKGLVDFNDLEHYALEILANENVANAYRDKFEYLFIDEYQDSNIVQETLIGYIKRENNRFMVGDVKQSIYRFRLADPSLFIEKYETFSSEKGKRNRRIDLSKNFRSREEIINGVNYIFKNIMSKQLGEIDYDERAYLYPGGSFEPIEDPSIELNLIEKAIDEEATEELSEDLEELSDIEVEAKMVAQRIQDILKTKIYDTKEEVYREVQYKDIVILMRTTQNWAHVFLETLIKENIPTYADTGSGYFQSIEIGIFLNLLKIIDNKRQDLPLISVMKSPIGKFTVEELVQIRMTQKHGSFFDAMTKFVEEEKEHELLGIKLNEFLTKIKLWARESRYMKIDNFIWKLFRDTGYYYYVGAMPGGQQRQANLRILLDRAVQFEKTSIRGLFNFIKFIEKIQNSKGDMGDAKTLGENDNVVRIMSIHKSKGLEFPVVFLCGTGKNFNLRDTSSDVLLHKDLGLGPKFVDLKLRVYRDTISKLAMKDRLKIESLSEEMRILYVALTRPVDKLIIFGSTRGLEGKINKWSRPINHYGLSSAKSYMDWIGMVLTKHPSSEVLRKAGGVSMPSENYLRDDSKWTVNLYSRQDVLNKTLEEEKKDAILKDTLLDYCHKNTTKYSETIAKRLNWQYAYEAGVGIPSKLSVSEIKKTNVKGLDHLGYNIPSLISQPKFLDKGAKNFTSAEVGTIIHFIMQHIDHNRINSLDEIKIQVNEMIQKELLSEEEVDEVNLTKIQNYFESPIGRRMLASNKVYREVPFNMKCNAQDVIHGLDKSTETLLVQGTIDCYFEENDEIVLVDYKNNEITENNLDRIVNAYKDQLHFYKTALEKILNKKVKESYLYMFHIDKAIRVE
ncbi:helicase-exonuclease AddAB subunit AddA [Serpentinicella sp. ANB-PHB4]|uniref:helicase-exonuclease AddAB subunit AddA n=1 Tax=Serpentinicella sp. ANB-PHB4 TaxID=3074076 RepID=UPI002854E513|nr:helicase-exonuclease AddAB subunit AddA [Serpentinicella sp. ANB-PHB4]MDR5659333.1 helicase-exonuclease AddAB subunit AddA [Serpentinicella sp. ANB-PHB4]